MCWICVCVWVGIRGRKQKKRRRRRKEKRQVVVLSLFISYSSFSIRHLMFAGLDFELSPVFLPADAQRCVFYLYTNTRVHIIILWLVSFIMSFSSSTSFPFSLLPYKPMHRTLYKQTELVLTAKNVVLFRRFCAHLWCCPSRTHISECLQMEPGNWTDEQHCQRDERFFVGSMQPAASTTNNGRAVNKIIYLVAWVSDVAGIRSLFFSFFSFCCKHFTKHTIHALIRLM